MSMKLFLVLSLIIVSSSQLNFLQEEYLKSFSSINFSTFHDIATLSGHLQDVTSLIKVDDQTFASLSKDSTIKIWQDNTLVKSIKVDSSVSEFQLIDSNTILTISPTKLSVVVIHSSETKTYLDSINTTGVVVQLSNNLISFSDISGKIYIWNYLVDNNLINISGHNGEVKAITQVNGDLIASSGKDQTICIWKIKTGEQTLKIQKFLDGVVGKLLMTTNNILVSGGQDGMIKLWNYTSGELIKSFDNQKYDVSFLIQVNDSTIATSSNDGSVKLWNIVSFGQPKIIYGSNSYTTSLIRLSDNIIARGSNKLEIKIIDVTSGNELQVIPKYDGKTNIVLMNSNTLVFNGWFLKIKVYVSLDNSINTLLGHTQMPSVLINLGDNQIVSGSGDNTIRIWDKSSGQNLKTFKSHSTGVRQIIQLGDGILASSGDGSEIQVWDYENEILKFTLNSHSYVVSSLLKISDSIMFSGSYDTTIKVWDIKKGDLLKTIQNSNKPVKSLTRINESQVVALTDESIKIIDINSFEAIRTATKVSSQVTNVLQFDNNVISYADNSSFIFMNYTSGNIVSQISDGNYPKVLVKISEDIICYDSKYDIKITNWKTKNTLFTLKGHTAAILAIKSISDDRIVSASVDNTLKVWNATTGNLIKTLRGHDSEVELLTDEDDQGIIGSSSKDKSIKLWNLNKN